MPTSGVLSGRRRANALGSLSVRADVVILDSPALDAATDAAVLAPLATGVLVVARLGSTRARELDAAVRELRAVGAELPGLVTVPPARIGLAMAERWPGARVHERRRRPLGAGPGGGR